MSDLDRAIWTAAYMAPMPILTALRDAVLYDRLSGCRSGSSAWHPTLWCKSCRDLIQELIRGSAFDCRAMVCDCADDSVLTGKDRPPASWKLDLRLMGWFLLKDLSPTESSISTGQD